MDEFLEEQLDLTKTKIIELEKSLSIMHDNIVQLSEQIKQTQTFLIKMAQNQAEITKRVSLWPYIAVPSNRGERDD